MLSVKSHKHFIFHLQYPSRLWITADGINLLDIVSSDYLLSLVYTDYYFDFVLYDSCSRFEIKKHRSIIILNIYNYYE